MKKTMKIMLAAVLSIAMLLTFAAAAEDTLTNAGTADLISAAAPESDTIDAHHDEHALDIFTDAPAQDSWKYQGLNCAVNNGTMTGHENKIRPDDSLTRAEMVTMMVRVLGAHATKAEIEHYVDVVAGQWYYEALQSGVAVKIINGSGNKMMPNSPITREQTFTILARTFLFSAKTDASSDFVDNSKVSSWAKNATNALIDADVVRGDNTKTLRPQDNVTRAEFAAMLDRVACLFVNKDANYSGKKVTGSLIVNDATADLSGATIEGDLIITDAVGAENIDLSDVTVTGRIVIRGGEVNLNEGTTAGEVVVGNPTSTSKVTAAAGVEVPKVVIAENANDVEIDVPAKEVVIDSSANEVTINKDAENVTVNGSDNTVKVTEGTKVDSVKTEGNNTNVAVDKGAKVENVTVNGESSKVTGSGDVGNATVNGYDSKVETPNTNVTDNSPATKPGSDDTTKPSTGDSTTTPGTTTPGSTQGPNSKPSDSSGNASLPSGGTNKPVTPSTSLEIYGDGQSGTYISYGPNEADRIYANVTGKTITFDLSDTAKYNPETTLLDKLFVDTNTKEVCKAYQASQNVTGFRLVSFNTDEEKGIGAILSDMINSTSKAVTDMIGVTQNGVPVETYNIKTLANMVDSAYTFYSNDMSGDKWLQGLFTDHGISFENERTVCFKGTIKGENVIIKMIVPEIQ